MGYAPMGVQEDAIRMQAHKEELLKVQKYLNNNLDVDEYQGYTRECVCRAIQNIDSFEFLP